MRFGRPLLRLPISFDEATLVKEVVALGEEVWQPHPQAFEGNLGVPLVSRGGTVNDDLAGPMAPTEALGRCPYIQEIIGAFETTCGRSRLMGLEPGADVPPHVDVNYYWRTHLRIHIPVITNPGVTFFGGNMSVHMKPGECWLLDSFYSHTVVNKGDARRIHLVIDTVGSTKLWDMIESAETAETVKVEPGSGTGAPIEYEQINWPSIMSPWEIRNHIAYLTGWTEPSPLRDKIMRQMDRFVISWSSVWARFGTDAAGHDRYNAAIIEGRDALLAAGVANIRMKNGYPLIRALDNFIFGIAVAPPKMREMIGNDQRVS